MRTVRTGKVNPEYAILHALNFLKMVSIMVQNPTSVRYLSRLFDVDSRTIYRKLSNMRSNGFRFEKHPGHQLKIIALPEYLHQLLQEINSHPITPNTHTHD